mmetsp:Transcript_18173/g.25156  ORF Transcript_18173/g.25156 Transcript_18173/m.25156 type:complete len:181 (+) Transcript_18173:299-841(+)
MTGRRGPLQIRAWHVCSGSHSPASSFDLVDKILLPLFFLHLLPLLHLPHPGLLPPAPFTTTPHSSLPKASHSSFSVTPKPPLYTFSRSLFSVAPCPPFPATPHSPLGATPPARLFLPTVLVAAGSLCIPRFVLGLVTCHHITSATSKGVLLVKGLKFLETFTSGVEVSVTALLWGAFTRL